MIRLLALILFTAMLAAPAPSAAGSDDDVALKTLHRQYTGYAYGDGTMDALTYEERDIDSGSHDPAVASEIRRVGLVYRTDETFAKAHTSISTGFTGRTFWYSDENGMTTQVGGNALPPLYARDLLWSDAIVNLPWTHAETDDDHGRKLVHVQVKLSEGTTIDLYVDAQTGAYAHAVIDSHGDYVEDIRVLDYTELKPGVRVISRWSVAGSDSVAVRDHFTYGLPIADADLHPPAQVAHWTFGTGTPVALTFTHHRIVVHASVNGVPGTFLVDTGAGGIFLSGAFARRANLAAIGHSSALSLYGEDKTDIGKISTLAFGDNVLHDVIASYGQRELDTSGPDGLMGYDVFASAFVSIDFDAKTMTIRDPSTIDVRSMDGVHVTASFGEGQPVIPMLLNKWLPFDAIVDTGNPSGVVLPSYLLPKYGLRYYPPSRGSGSCGSLDSLSIGSLVYQSPNACLEIGGEGRWVIVGLDFLNTFKRIDFDYPTGQIIFVPKGST